MPTAARTCTTAGNILNTNIESAIRYSNGVVTDSDGFGPTGRYFTRKIDGGLFVLGADLDGVDHFEIRGGLGADSIGTADGTVLTLERGGRRFLGFVKRVFDGLDLNTGLFDPSVNHLVIVEDNDLATQTFEEDTDSDQHRVSGLAGIRRLYYLLYASGEGLRIGDDETQAIFETFIDAVGVEPGWVRAATTSGQIEARSEFDLGLDLEVGLLAPGIENAVLELYSNDPEANVIQIPIRLRVNSPPLPDPGRPRSRSWRIRTPC